MSSGAQRDADFQSRLRVMDIDESDLQMLFEMIDVARLKHAKKRLHLPA